MRPLVITQILQRMTYLTAANSNTLLQGEQTEAIYIIFGLIFYAPSLLD